MKDMISNLAPSGDKTTMNRHQQIKRQGNSTKKQNDGSRVVPFISPFYSYKTELIFIVIILIIQDFYHTIIIIIIN